MKAVEAKRRRRDVLVDADMIFAFYDRLIPGDVFNGPLFEKWRKREESRDPQALYMSRDELLRHDAGGITAEHFPDTLHIHGMRLPLTYRLEPGQPQDGVTVTVPIEALNQLHEERLQWLVPGLVEEKIAALIKTLPKEVRRNFVPTPAIAEACAAELTFGEGSMLEAITAELDRLTGVAVSPALWRPDDVPDHLRMNLDVVDAEGSTLASGRDLAAIRAQLNGVTAGIDAVSRSSEFDRDGVVEWDFGDLPERIERRRAGIVVYAYPALIDRGESVSLRMVDSPEQARGLTRSGLRRLFALAMREELHAHVEYAPGIGQITDGDLLLVEYAVQEILELNEPQTERFLMPATTSEPAPRSMSG